MNYADLFDALDLGRPELHEVQAAVAASDKTAALKALAQHLRHRTTPRWYFRWQDSPAASEQGPFPEAEKM